MNHKLPLNNLNTFATAAEYLSFQEAASVLFVTPSAVSHQVRNLERLLGYKLFERLDKGICLTSEGAKLFGDIQAPFKQLQKASKKAVQHHAGDSLALSVAPVFATGWLLPRLNDFYAAHPEVRLSVVASSELANLNSGTFDASIRMGTGKWPDTLSYKLYSKNIVAIAHPNALAKTKQKLEPEQIVHFPRVSNASMPSMWTDWFLSAGITLAKESESSLQVESSAQVVAAVQSGGGIGLIDKKFFSTELASGLIVIASKHVHCTGDGYFLNHPDSNEISPALKAFKHWLFQEVEESEPL